MGGECAVIIDELEEICNYSGQGGRSKTEEQRR